jgi:hypothetical protein
MLSHKGEAATAEAGFMAAEAGFMAVEAGFMAAEAGFMAAEAGFMAVEAFTVRVVSEVFMAGAFMVGADSPAFTGAILGIFTADVSQAFTAITIFLAMIVFSFPVSMDTRGGGVGVTPIRIGVTRTTPITLTIRTTLTIRISRCYLCPEPKVLPMF